MIEFLECVVTTSERNSVAQECYFFIDVRSYKNLQRTKEKKFKKLEGPRANKYHCSKIFKEF